MPDNVTDNSHHKLRRKLVRENAYRDAWLFIITGLVVLALLNVAHANNRVAQGRQVGTAIQCAIISAVSDAGRSVILQPTRTPDSPFFKFLESHGYPPLKVRRDQAKEAAQAYVTSIGIRVERSVGHKGDGLIRKDGTIDCRKLAQITNVKPISK